MQSIESLLETLGIDKLSRETRIALAQAIWDTVEQDDGLLLTEAQGLELDRRIAAHQANPERAVPWEEVKARALRRLAE